MFIFKEFICSVPMDTQGLRGPLFSLQALQKPVNYSFIQITCVKVEKHLKYAES